MRNFVLFLRFPVLFSHQVLTTYKYLLEICMQICIYIHIYIQVYVQAIFISTIPQTPYPDPHTPDPEPQNPNPKLLKIVKMVKMVIAHKRLLSGQKSDRELYYKPLSFNIHLKHFAPPSLILLYCSSLGYETARPYYIHYYVGLGETLFTNLQTRKLCG